MNYERTVAEIKSCFKRDVEIRFKIGRLVDEASAHRALSTISRDVGVSKATLETYRDVYRFWGDRRIPVTWKAVTWSMYSWPLWWDEESRDDAREQLLTRGTGAWGTILEEHAKKRAAERAPVDIRAFAANQAIRWMEQAVINMRMADTVTGEEYDALTEAYTRLRDELDRKGISPKRRVRVA